MYFNSLIKNKIDGDLKMISDKNEKFGFYKRLFSSSILAIMLS